MHEMLMQLKFQLCYCSSYTKSVLTWLSQHSRGCDRWRSSIWDWLPKEGIRVEFLRNLIYECSWISNYLTAKSQTYHLRYLLIVAFKIFPYTRWFNYYRDYLCVNKSQFVPVIFIFHIRLFFNSCRSHNRKPYFCIIIIRYLRCYGIIDILKGDIATRGGKTT